MIGLYKISYNIAWHLNESIDPEKYLEANKNGILSFCQENTNKLIQTSINKSRSFLP